MSSYSKSRIFVGGRGEYIWGMLSGQLRGHEGSFEAISLSRVYLNTILSVPAVILCVTRLN